MTSYRAIQVSSAGSLELTTRPLVPAAAGLVRVRVEACGICHSDSIAVHAHPETEVGRVPGHEVVGRIDEIGDGVAGWATGDRVGIGFLGGHCGTCEQCRRGQFVNCLDQPMTGVTVDGGYAEYVYARPSGLVALPDDLSAVELAPLLCAGFTTYNALIKSGFKPGDLVAVQGIGGLGHLGLQYARALGARVVAIARGEAKAELAKSLGAEHYIDAAATDPGNALQALGGADVVLATAASGSSMSALIPGLAQRGTLVVVGASYEPIEVVPMSLIVSGARIVGSLTGTTVENEDNIAFASRQGISAMIEKISLHEAPGGYDRMMSGDARFRVVVSVN